MFYNVCMDDDDIEWELPDPDHQEALDDLYQHGHR